MKVFLLLWFVLIPGEKPLMNVQMHFSEEACNKAAVERLNSLKPAYEAGQVTGAGFKCIPMGYNS